MHPPSQDPASYDPVVDPLRRAALAGLPLIVLSNGNLDGPLREALAVSGRLGDLVNVHLDAAGEWLSGSLTGACRRALPPPGGSPGAAASVLTMLDLVGYLGEPERAIAFLPRLAPGEATGPRAVVHVVSGIPRLAQGYGTWLHDLALERAVAEGRPAPSVLLAGRIPNWTGHLPDRPGYRLRTHAHPLRTIAGWGREEDLGRAFDPGTGEAEAWAHLLDRFDAGAEIVALGTAAGAMAAVQGDRLLVAREGVELGAPGRPVIEVYEVAGGTCAGVRVREGATDAGANRRDLVEALRGGLGNAGSLRRGEGRGAVKGVAYRLVEGWEGVGLPEPLQGRLDMRLCGVLNRCEAAMGIRHLLDTDPSGIGARRDFLLTWPFFAAELFREDVRACVDAGEPTLPVIARVLGTSPAIARRLVGLRSSQVFHRDESLALGGDFPGLLEAIGHDLLPARGDASDWSSFLGLVVTLHAVVVRANLHNIAPEAARRLLLGIPGRTWNERMRHLVAQPGRGDTGSAADMASGLRDWLGRLGGGPAATYAILLAYGSLSRIAAASARWHADRRLSGGIGGMPEDAAWPVPFDALDLGDGWSAHALPDVRALRAEGGEGTDGDGMAGLDHCVGGYGPACMRGESLVISLRRAEGGLVRRVSTAELAPSPGSWRIDGRPYRLVQHRGLANADPSKEAGNRLSRLSYLLAGGVVPVRAEALGLRDYARPEEADPRGEALRLHPAWRRILPEPFAGMDAERFIAFVSGCEAACEATRKADPAPDPVRDARVAWDEGLRVLESARKAA